MEKLGKRKNPIVSRPQVVIYTDGACQSTVGGWAAILLFSGIEKVLTGGMPSTTNNQMELMAIYQALKALKRPCDVIIFSDSRDAIGWLSQEWKRNVEHIDKLCLQIQELIAEFLHHVTFKYVRGHSSDLYNERCDELARQQIRFFQTGGMR